MPSLITPQNTQTLEDPWLHWFLYGDSGAGKTTAAATFPRPIFLVPHNERSITTLSGQDVDYIEITGQSGPLTDGGARGGLDAVLTALEKMYAADADSFPWDTIVLESLTHYVDLVQEEMTSGNARPMEQRHWGLLAAHIRNVQTRLRGMEVHVVYTALASVKQDDAGAISGGPLIPGQSAVKLPSACDIIGYCEAPVSAKKPVYNVHFRRKGHYFARSRFRGMPAVVPHFSYDAVQPYLSGDRKATTTKKEQS